LDPFAIVPVFAIPQHPDVSGLAMKFYLLSALITHEKAPQRELPDYDGK
jgi:hypothetical protein